MNLTPEESQELLRLIMLQMRLLDSVARKLAQAQAQNKAPSNPTPKPPAEEAPK